MTNLLTLQEYRDDFYKDESGYWKRMAIVSGCFFGFWMAVSFYFILGKTPNLLHPRTPGEILSIGVSSGLLFGFAFPWQFKKKMWRMVEQLYRRDPSLSDTLDRRFTHRLPCTLINGPVGIGGVLYAGSAGIAFLPHGEAPLEGIRLTPAEELMVKLTPSPYPLNIRRILLIPKPQPLMEIRRAVQSTYFLVPTPARTTKLVEQLLQERG